MSRVFVIDVQWRAQQPCVLTHAQAQLKQDKAATDYFTPHPKNGSMPDISHRYCQILQHSDGYGYAKGGRGFSPIS